MDNIIYGGKSINDLDKGIDFGGLSDLKSVCIEIQNAFKSNNIELTLLECKSLYNLALTEDREWVKNIAKLNSNNIYQNLQPLLELLLIDRLNRVYLLMEQCKISKAK